jgi:hypothetical protein
MVRAALQLGGAAGPSALAAAAASGAQREAKCAKDKIDDHKTPKEYFSLGVL